MKLNDLTKAQILEELNEKAFITYCDDFFLTIKINNKDYFYYSCDKTPEPLIYVKRNKQEIEVTTFKISDIDSILIMNTEENRNFIETHKLFQDIEFE